MSKPKVTLSDIIEGIEDIIEEWGDDARGGDEFTAIATGMKPLREDDYGLPVFPELPVCAVATLSLDYGVTAGFEVDSISEKVNLSEEAERFLGHLICFVDGDEFIYSRFTPVLTTPKNPKRDWRLALDRTLAYWQITEVAA